MDNEKALMIRSQGLTKLSKTEIILAEQDKSESITLIAYLLQRLSKLYQLPNWSDDNAVFLAEWIFDNYKYDSLDDVITCLRNPPHTDNKQWRLTPDTIKEWMEIILERTAEKREAENLRMKETFKEEIKEINYDAFKAKIEKEGLPGEKKREVNADYEKFRMDYLVKQEQESEKRHRKYFLSVKPDATEDQIQAYLKKISQFENI